LEAIANVKEEILERDKKIQEQDKKIEELEARITKIEDSYAWALFGRRCQGVGHDAGEAVEECLDRSCQEGQKADEINQTLLSRWLPWRAGFRVCLDGSSNTSFTLW